MLILVVSYHLTSSEEHYEGFFQALEQENAWFIFDGCAIINHAPYSSVGLKNKLTPHLTDGDRLFICQCSGTDIAGHLPETMRKKMLNEIYLPSKSDEKEILKKIEKTKKG